MRVVVERGFGIELTKQELIVKVKVSPINGSVVFAEGIVGSLVSTSRALIRRASIIGASIIGASIIGALIIGASIIGASIIGASIIGALIRRASNLARKRSNSSLLVNSRQYSSFNYFLSSFR